MGKDHDDQMLLATQEGYRFNPVRLGIEMLAQAAGLHMLPMTTSFVKSNASSQRVHGFAASDMKGSPPRIYLINKMETSMMVHLQLPPGMAPIARASSMVDTADHWGTLVSSAVTCAQTNQSATQMSRLLCVYELPAVSFTMFAGKKPDWANLTYEYV